MELTGKEDISVRNEYSYKDIQRAKSLRIV